MSFFAKSIVIVTLGFLCVLQCNAQGSTGVAQKQGVVLNHVPQRIDAKALYLFYISGYIVESRKRSSD